MTPYRVAESHCPACEKTLNGAAPVNDEAASGTGPAPGDLNVCGHCGVWLTFSDAMQIRLMTPDEIMTLSAADRALLDLATEAITRARRLLIGQ